MNEFARQSIMNAVQEDAGFTVAGLVTHFRGLLPERDVRETTWWLIGEHRLTINRDWTLALAEPVAADRGSGG